MEIIAYIHVMMTEAIMKMDNVNNADLNYSSGLIMVQEIARIAVTIISASELYRTKEIFVKIRAYRDISRKKANIDTV